MDDETPEKKYYRFDVRETFGHHVGVWAESEEEAEEKIFSVMDDKDREPITKEGTRLDGYTEIHSWGHGYRDDSWTTLNPEDEPDLN